MLGFDASRGGGLARDDDASEELRACRIGLETRARHARHSTALGRIDNHLRDHRLPSAAVRHHDAGELSVRIEQHFGRIGSREERDARIEQSLIQRLLHVQRRRHDDEATRGHVLAHDDLA